MSRISIRNISSQTTSKVMYNSVDDVKADITNSNQHNEMKMKSFESENSHNSQMQIFQTISPPTSPRTLMQRNASSQTTTLSNPDDFQSNLTILNQHRELENHEIISPLKRTALAYKLGLNPIRTVLFGRISQQESPRQKQNVQGDGNCFFRAITYILTGSEEQHLITRRRTIEHMKFISTRLQGYLNQNVSQYLYESGIHSDGVWATDAEIIGMASLLNTDIIVYAAYGTTSYQWLTYPASLNLSCLTHDALFISNFNDHFQVVLSTG